MPNVSISQAAKLAGISRTHLYRAYINKGKISLSKDHQGKPLIEVSELMRVFPGLRGNSNQFAMGDTVKNSTSTAEIPPADLLTERIKGLERLLQVQAAELAAYREREKMWTRLLEDKTPKKKRWWPFGKT
jgi:hypothetical protein